MFAINIALKTKGSQVIVYSITSVCHDSLSEFHDFKVARISEFISISGIPNHSLLTWVSYITQVKIITTCLPVLSDNDSHKVTMVYKRKRI